ncbi:Crp/Fnr family transcriptional regulator [Parasphingorhabdus sp. JC815]|uniref:Crp/Fnr family transcriptional regulator n=1 Tax=Parasphingorhabdus sp. JC815 TaxID=3232140 RepID=UPI003457EA54
MNHMSVSQQQLSFDTENGFYQSSVLTQKLKSYIHDEGVATVRHRGDYLFRQGENVGNIYYIDEGCVAIVHLCPNDHRQIFDFQFKNSIIMDAGSFGTNASHSAQCLSNVSMHILSTESFRRILLSEPQLYHAVGEVMNAALIRAYRGLSNIMCRQGSARVAYILLAVHNGNNLPSEINQPTRVDNRIKIRQVDLAAAIGVTPVYFNQILKKMKADGLIKLVKGEIEICDLNAVKELTHRH